MELRLRFPATQLAKWAAKYSYADDSGVIAIGQRACERGYYTKPELTEIGEWKSVRIRSRLASNTEEEVEEVTRLALGASRERLRIEALRLLCGVDWSIASVLLHFGHHDPYPILDFRALWSCGLDDEPGHTINLWLEYAAFCRDLHQESGLSMRNVDQALWQYSADNQAPPGRS